MATATAKGQAFGKKRGEMAEPHVVRVPKGQAPEYISLTSWQQFCWRFMGAYARPKVSKYPRLEGELLKAHLKLRPEEFLSTVYTAFFFSLIASIVVAVVVVTVLALLGQALFGVIIAVLVAFVIPVAVLFGSLGGPSGVAKKRRRDIDYKISSAMSFVSAMSSANVNVDVIFKELSKQPIYGSIREEAEWITRDTEFLGIDILTSLRRAAQRTPSLRFQDFLQGVVTTSTSGGQLKPYFVVKAEQYERENKLDMKARMETLGLMAETFVTVVVAFPLFLAVILAIMSLIGNGGFAIVIILYAIMGVMVPIMQFMFIFLIRSLTAET
jgi:flagellar protein FlaJ